MSLSSAYREKRLPKHFQQTIRKARKEIEEQPLRHVEYYEWQYQMQWEDYLFSAGQKRVSSLNLQEISDTTDIAFIAQKLRQTCFLLSHQAASFIEDYKKHLPKEHQESMYSFSRARLAYEKGHYGDVLQLLQRANYKDLLLNLAAKTLLQKTLYVTGAWEALESQLDAMTSFLARKDILTYHRNYYHNFAALLKKILTLNPHLPLAKKTLRARIEQTQPLTEKQWLLEQLGKV